MNRIQAGRWTVGLAAVLATSSGMAGPRPGATAAGGITQQPVSREGPAFDPDRPISERLTAPPGDSGTGGDGGGVADIGLTMIDFESLRHDDAQVTDIGVLLGGDYYFEDGYALMKPNDGHAFATFGTQEARYPGSTALFNNTIGGTTYLEPVDNIPCTLVSMEIANLNNKGPATVTFAGRRQDDTYVYKTVSTKGSFNRLETVTFEEFNNLVWVTWTQDSPYIQFDNIGVTKGTPEMNFQKAEHVDAGIQSEGPIYAEGDFVIVQGEGEPNPLSTFGTQHGLYPGSTALFNNTINGTITLYSLSTTEEYAEPFNIHSIDLSNLNGGGPATVHFTGKKASGGTVAQAFTLPGSGNGLHTFNFTGFHDLISLTWTQEAPFHQFDNLVVSRGQRTLEFEKLARADGASHPWGTHYRESGFQLDTKADNGFYTFGSQSSRWPGSTALFNNAVDDVTTLRTIDQRQFALRSIDIAALNGNDKVSVKFVGTNFAGDKVTQTFKTSGNGQRLETFYFDPAKFKRLKKVEWTQDSPFHQFDSIVIVPNQTDEMDFQALEHTDATSADVGTQYAEDGYVVRQGDGEPWPLTTWGTRSAYYPQSTAVFNNTVDGMVRLRTASGRDFDLLEIDLAKLTTTGSPCPVTFVGTRTDGIKVSQTFKIYTPFNPNVNRLQTCHFTGFDSLQYVEWRQVAPYHQFDNITLVESIPEDECYPDFNGDGTLDLFDFLAYVNAFNAGNPDANCDGNGDLDLFDFLCYVNAFNAGC
jgi:hypothetical protein